MSEDTRGYVTQLTQGGNGEVDNVTSLQSTNKKKRNKT